MARYYIKVPNWDAKLIYLGGLSEVNFDIRALVYRDAFRTALDPDLNATNWRVSDVSKWNGSNSTVNGYCFTIFHCNNGINTGPAWMFILPGRNGTFTAADSNAILQASQDQNFFMDSGGDTTFTSDGTPIIHYAPLGGTSDPYDVGYSATGSLSSGDFTAPTTNPYQDLATFMPSSVLKGVVFDGISTSYPEVRMLFVADDEKPFLATYACFGLEIVPSFCLLMGDIIEPYRPTDVETHGVLSFEHTFSTIQQGAIAKSSNLVQDEVGALVEVDLFYNTLFTRENVPFQDTTYPWDVVALQNSTYFKGYVDSDVLRVMGPLNLDLYSLYDGGSFIKFNESLCFPFVPNKVVWPLSPGS